MNQPFIGDYPRPELTHWFCMACRQHGMYKYGEHHCGDVPQVDRLAAERDAAVADAEALRLAARAYFTTIDNAPPFGAGDLALREHDAACDKTAHTLAVLAGARGPR